MKETSNPRQSLLYLLSCLSPFTSFRKIILIASPQDRYVPISSALILPRKGGSSPERESTVNEMVSNLMKSLIQSSKVISLKINFSGSKFDVMGRRAHVSLLEDDAFVESLGYFHEDFCLV